MAGQAVRFSLSSHALESPPPQEGRGKSVKWVVWSLLYVAVIVLADQFSRMY